MKHFIPTTYAALPGEKKWNKKLKKHISSRGPHAALLKLRQYVENDPSGTKYCLKLDIKKFFPNIDKAILKSLLRRKFKDKDLLWLLDDIVDSYDNGNPKGIPIGSYTSQYFGNFYLSYFDHWAKEEKHIKYLLRYMDDIVMKKAAKRLRRKVERGKALTLPNRSTVGSYNGILEWCDSTRLKEKTINQFIGGKYGKSKRKSGTKAA